MGRVKIIYAPDPKSSGSTPRTDVNTYSTFEGREIPVKYEGPNDYLKILEPKKGPKRLEFQPNLPKTLTPKGFTKAKLLMSMAKKQYDNIVRRTKIEGTLWEDPDFPANDNSIGIPELQGRLEWKRPKEISRGADFFIGGASRFDIEQGQLGDCWLLAVISSISSYEALFQHIIPPDQSIKSSDYVGVFRIRLWRYGQWIEVLVDDRLPVQRGTTRLVFMHSADDSEFWSALLEKAYAKLNGCYNNLSGGTQSEAMEDLTGGICETIELNPKQRPDNLVEQMCIYANKCCLMGCSITSNVREGKLPNGLITGHAYSVTGVTTVNYRGKKQYLIRCRNPWGGQYEWKGPWADKSSEWNSISAEEKKRISLNFTDDGEFWMAYEDFVTCFSQLEVCHLGLESLEYNQDFRGKRRLQESIFSGAWEKNVNAGGCINNRASYWTNPQFSITVSDPDPDDQDDLCTIIVALMQRDVRRQMGADFFTIGFMLYEVDSKQTTLLSKAQLLTKGPCGKSRFSNCREVSNHFRLKPGSYVVIPSTFEPNVEAHFILRVLSQVEMDEKQLDVENANEDVPDDIIEALKLENLLLNEDEEIEKKFNEICDPKTKAVNATLLKELLNNSTLQDIPGFTGFDIEMCRSMVASVDNNLTGLVELSEFMDLWQKAKAWKMIFLKYDEDQSGHFKATEFREALKGAGFDVSNKLFHSLVKRYEDPDTQVMRFEDFMLCCIRLKIVFETEAAQARILDGTPVFSREDFLRFALYT